MATEVRIQFELTPEYYKAHFAEAGKAVTRPGSAILAYTSIAFCSSVPFALWLVWHSEDLDQKWLVTATLVLPLVIGFFAVRLFSMKRVVDDLQKTLSAADRQVSVTVNSKGWLVESAFSRMEQQWGTFQKVIRADEGFLTQETLGGSRWLPRTGFESEAAIETFVEMVKSHDVQYEDRRRAG